MSMLRHRFSYERWGGGLNHFPLLFRKIVYRIKRHLKMINALRERKTYQPLTLLWLGTPSRTMDQLAARNSQPDRYQLATDRYQLATDKYQLTTRNLQLTDINSELTNIN